MLHPALVPVSDAHRRPRGHRAVAVVAVLMAVLSAACSSSGGKTDGAAASPTAQTSTTVGPAATIQADTPPPDITVDAPAEQAMAVAPPEDSPVHRIRRDCPLTQRMNDGRILWLFCDSSMHDENTGALTVFQNTTAGWATSDNPTTVVQAVDSTNNPYRFLTPTAAYTPCGSDPAVQRFMWMNNSIKLDEPDGKERLLIYYESMCAVSHGQIKDELFHDLGLATYVYDPANPPAETAPIKGEVVVEQLFSRPSLSESPFGVGAVLRDNTIYVYRCKGSGECFVGKVQAQRAAFKEDYTFWNGTDWVAGEASATPMVMSGHYRSTKPSVQYLAASNLYVMLDSGDLGKGSAQLQVARSPQGPWSKEVEFNLPRCVYAVPKACFGLEAHADLSTSAGLYVTWLDPNLDNSTSPVQSVHIPVRLTAAKDKDGRSVPDATTLTG